MIKTMCLLAAAAPAFWPGLLAQTSPDSNGDLLLRDFKPKTRLVVKETHVLHARFPVIDVHFHMDPDADPHKVVETMDQLNLQMVVNLGNHDMWGDKLKGYVAKWVKPFPTRFAVMANIDPSMVNDPEFGAKAVAQLENDVNNGAIALKIYKDLGLVWRNPNGKLIPADNPRFDPVWDACARLKIPVLIHVNDTMPFFDPVDRYNERYLSLTLDKRSSWYGKVDVTHEQLALELEHIIAKHPRTTFISAHVGMNYEDLTTAARWLDMYPSLNYDIAASYKHLGRQPYTARRFLIKYQNRILFGCDIGHVPALDVYRYMFRVLETDDEYFQHVEPNAGLPWRLYGLFLPDPVLEKIYRLNAMKLLPPFRDRT